MHFAEGVVLEEPDGLRCHIEVRDIADQARVTRNRLQKKAERAHVDRHPEIKISPQYLEKIPASVSRLCEQPNEGGKRESGRAAAGLAKRQEGVKMLSRRA
jgi:hypothetical protein